MYSCTQGYFSKHVHIFYLILSVTNINDKSQGGNTGFLTFSPMFCAVYAAVAFYLCLQIDVQNAVVSIGKTELERERDRDKERERERKGYTLPTQKETGRQRQREGKKEKETERRRDKQKKKEEEEGREQKE